jgi:hypothetical protein
VVIVFYKGRKKGYVILIFVLATLMVGGYFLGTLIGNQVLGYNVGKQDEEPGYQVIRTVNRDNLDKPDYQVPTIEVITRDTKLVFEKVYIGCGHKRVEERRARENEIGLSIQSIALRFPEWSIADYTTERIVFTKEVNDFCPGHFLLKDRDGVVVIYMPSEEGVYDYPTAGFYLKDASNVTLRNCEVIWGENRPEYFRYALESHSVENLILYNFIGDAAYPDKNEATFIE